MFNINFQLIAKRLLPVFDRLLPVLSGFVKVLVWPLKYINDTFQAFVASTIKELSYTSQVILLEAALNETFPDATPPIFISDGDSAYQRGYEFLAEDLQPVSGFEYLVTDGEPDPGGFSYLAEDYSNVINFIVNVPVSLTFNSHAMTELVQKYCPVDKNFTIQTF